MATEYTAKKEGYVQHYRTEATITPLADTYYFEVELNANIGGDGEKSTWGLPRNRFYTINQAAMGPMAPQGELAISYSNTHQAIIATIKDALHKGNKVKLEGIKLVAGGGGTRPPDVSIPFEDMIVIDIPRPARPGAPEIPGSGSGEPVEVPRPTGEHEGVVVDVRPVDDIPQYELRQVTIYKK